MGAVMLAWLVGMGLVSWRSVKVDDSPPAPGDLLVASGAFAIAGVVGMADETVGNLLAWGLDAAALLRILDGQDAIPSPLSSLSTQSKAASSRLAGNTTTSTPTINKQGGAGTSKSYTPT
jgi:hypothetical protein